MIYFLFTFNKKNYIDYFIENSIFIVLTSAEHIVKTIK